MRDKAKSLAAKVLRLPLGNEHLVPARDIVDAAPCGLLLCGDIGWHVVRPQHLILPGPQFEARDKVRFERASRGATSRRHAIVMVGDSIYETEGHATTFKEN